jgi:hypothetical protein
VTAARKDKGMGSEVGGGRDGRGDAGTGGRGVPPRSHVGPRVPASGQPACPFCQSIQTELISPFGSQLLMSQHRCRSCLSYFEALREDP